MNRIENIISLLKANTGKSVNNADVAKYAAFNEEVTLETISAMIMIESPLKPALEIMPLEEVVDQMFTSVFGYTETQLDAIKATEAGKAGFQYWVDELKNNGDLINVNTLAIALLNGAAEADVARAEANVAAEYESYLNYDPEVEGQTFTLTTGNDVFELTTGDDTIIATSATLAVTDVIVDESTTDNDTMNVTLTAAGVAAEIKNVENINVNVNAFAGTAVAFDATNTTGATITMSSDKLGFDGNATVAGVGKNTVVAGTGVTNLATTGNAGSTVDAGSASTVSISGATGTAGRTETIIANGDLDLTVATSTTLSLSATEASKIDLTTASVTDIDVTGTNDVTIVVDTTVANITDSTTDATVVAEIDAAAAFDATGFDVDSININVDMGAVALDVADAAVVTLAKTQTNLTVNGLGLSTSDVTVETAKNQTALVFTNVNETTLNLTDELVIGRLEVMEGKTTNISAAKKTTISALDADLTGADDSTVKISGAGEVILSSVTSDGDTVDASAMTGVLTYTMDVLATNEHNVVGSKGKTTVIMGAGDQILSFEGQGAVDTIDATKLTIGTLAASLGAGDDIINVGAVLAGGVIAIDGGAGTDTITFETATNFSAATFSTTNVEKLAYKDADVNTDITTAAVTFAGAQLSAKTYEIVGSVDDTLTVNVAATAGKTTDLSSLKLTNVGEFVITGGTGNETIIGTSGNDTIDGGAGADVLTGGAGKDTFVFDTIGDSTAAAMAKITDFKITDDKLDLVGTATDITAAKDVTDVITNGGTVTKAIFADAKSTVDLEVSAAGIFTIKGTKADVALADTLEEITTLINDNSLVAASKIVAFEFKGNTYIYEEDTTAGDTTFNIIELTGVTGITSLADAAAANTIVIA
jgi:Ca2+-binding RTX toxin-like protein